MPRRVGCRGSRVATTRFWSLGPRSSSCESDSARALGLPLARSSRSAARRPSRRAAMTSSSLRPAAGVRRLERRRAARGRSSRCRGRGSPGRSAPRSGRRRRPCESDSSAIRSATRRLVLARRLSLMTPAGRWVAMIRWMPSERPRWAMSTTPSTNSGTSPTRAANSSITSTSAGGQSGSPRFSSSSRSLAFLRLSRCSRWCSSARRLVSARRTRCGLRSVTRPDAVRQLDAVGERRAALVVDEEERHPVGAVLGGHARAPTPAGTRDLPAPVVPPTRACGPWLRRSRGIASLAPWPTRARRLPAFFSRGRSRWLRSMMVLFCRQRSIDGLRVARRSRGRPAPGTSPSSGCRTSPG